MKVLADYWFSDMGGGHCGIVVGEDEHTGERKAYIGTGEVGSNQEADIQRIRDGGQKLSLSFLEGLVGLLKAKTAKEGE